MWMGGLRLLSARVVVRLALYLHWVGEHIIGMVVCSVLCCTNIYILDLLFIVIVPYSACDRAYT
jgi:predicted branched-subunit amino acid permease